MAWYNKYRPQTFDEVVGQTLAKEILQKSLETGSIKHAYLFSGPKGIGKTTIARIFANTLNKTLENPEASLDIIEMDAASNTGIDDVRQLIESAKSVPLSAPYKIYIIDEVHMLSKAAMNALLKILEEPPTYIIFLLATTNPEKLLPTILSRLTKLPLLAHTKEDVISHLVQIAQKESVKIDKDALSIIANHAAGSQRDAINLLETVSTYGLEKYDIQKVSEILGLLPVEYLDEIANALLVGITPDLLTKINSFSVEPTQFLSQLLEYCIDKSFYSKGEFNELIVPIAETISLQLPLNSIITAIAIISQKVNKPIENNVEKVEVLKSKKTIEVPDHTSLPNSPIELPTEPITKDQAESIETPPLSSYAHEGSVEKISNDGKNIPKNLELDNSIPTIEFSSEAVKSEDISSDIQQQIQSIKNESDCPPILKMILPDLIAVQKDPENLEFTVTNGIFVAQLQSSKMQSFIFQKILAKTGKSYLIKVLQREKSITPINISSQTKPSTTSHSKETVADISQPATKPVLESENQPPLTAKKNQSKIFYKVYNSLPEPLEKGSIPVFEGQVPAPRMPTTTNAKQNEWDEVEDMFELE
jgi:DNA polymerase III subunit gamma/tau